MKIILLIGRGANQRALANRIAAKVDILHIAIVDKSGKKKQGRIRSVAEKLCGLPLSLAWRNAMAHYENLYPDYPGDNRTEFPSIRHSSLVEFMALEQPDLVIVSGTNLLKEDLIQSILPKGRIMNLHTGLSPYIKGGPNCTNWCLATKQFHLVGNTIMWLDIGIDTGNIIRAETTPLTGRESLSELQIKVLDHAHNLYTSCVERLARGDALPSVPQSEIGDGKTFYSREWTWRRKLAALASFQLGFRKGVTETQLRIPADIQK